MTKSSHDVDIAVLGGGMTGLMMSEALARRLPPSQSAVVLEPRDDYEHDRTFCFWDVEDIGLEDCIQHKWQKWSLRVGGEEHVAESKTYSYCHVPGDAFYKKMLATIDGSSTTSMHLGTTARDVSPQSSGLCRIKTDHGEITARHVFDTRPSPALVEASTTLQHFVGWHVRTKRPVFDPTTVTLMDFDVPQEHGLHFMYVLPFSETEAVVESTFFSRDVLAPEVYEKYIRGYLIGRYQLTLEEATDVEVVRRERGVVPMTTFTHPQPEVDSWHFLGTRGGFVRPATGYCFHATGRWVQSHAAWLCEPKGQPPGLRSPGLLWLDSVLLSFIDRHPHAAPGVFFRLFQRVQPDALVRFLSDVGSVWDTFQVMCSMPVWPFVQEAAHLGIGQNKTIRLPQTGTKLGDIS